MNRDVKHHDQNAAAFQSLSKRESFRQGNFEFASCISSLSPSAQIERFEASTGVKAPEITFLDNFIRIRHVPSGLVLNFTTGRALAQCRDSYLETLPVELRPQPLKVRAASLWTASSVPALPESHEAPSVEPSLATLPPVIACADSLPRARAEFPQLSFGFDWTYSSPYQGHFTRRPAPPLPDDEPRDDTDPDTAALTNPLACKLGLCDGVCTCLPDPASPQDPAPAPSPAAAPELSWSPSPWPLPAALLARRDPIRWYSCVRLFEDELHDNGASVLEAKLRVMDHSWLLLLRLFLRVDGVVLRVRETRYCYCFGPPAASLPSAPPATHLLRETRLMEAAWDALPALGLPLSPAAYRSADEVARQLPVVHEQLDCLRL